MTKVRWHLVIAEASRKLLEQVEAEAPQRAAQLAEERAQQQARHEKLLEDIRRDRHEPPTWERVAELQAEAREARRRYDIAKARAVMLDTDLIWTKN